MPQRPVIPPPHRSTVTELLHAAERAVAGAGVELTTSGSTGQPKRVVLAASALRASATATAERVGGQGHWLLALPSNHVAGWQVVVRSAVAGTVPTRIEGPFTVDAFRRAAQRLPEGPRLVSLVPTQLLRLLDDDAGTSALAGFTAVLIGGAALPAPLRRRAEAAGVRLHRTYGMTETSGGCVYDGTPLTGVEVRLDEGRVLLGGPVLADGYADDPALTAQRFDTDALGKRWFVTDDAGELTEDGVLQLLGRIDDLINTGGFKVAPRPVEEALHQLPGVREALVLGVPDPEWGQRVAAVLVGADDRSVKHTVPPDTRAVRDALRDHLPAHALPRQVLWLSELPMLASGKPDRVALRAMCAGSDGTMDPYRGPRSELNPEGDPCSG
ncbi:o-succinylbenzoate--CoA ligase [Ornithinimicrobium sp. F0845]|uniref:o-succinylbenzoate--CoA ligase n=1 Tax=Ornithinimicrobium sp. F0845 TaxID=2926412 RepID=UPI001FF1BE0C|nr:o-succinylbenzoate--CoA ligase [Ornithinimicrobium sp. F0845]